jgi:hypothetical protein
MDINICIHWLTFTYCITYYANLDSCMRMTCLHGYFEHETLVLLVLEHIFVTMSIALYILIYSSKLYHTLNQLDQCVAISKAQ